MYILIQRKYYYINIDLSLLSCCQLFIPLIWRQQEIQSNVAFAEKTDVMGAAKGGNLHGKKKGSR